MKSLLMGLLNGKSSHKPKSTGNSKPYCADPLSHPDLRRMDLREIGDVYINPEKTQP
ncbi:hypothetical protein [Pseudovibrio sp. Tun.PSC04-5.I4]|uniref:hypothetical protein n=1 Tax=Pseudovibrio sp. Tun.PSC04-5.I4 TaxID=1798213 RepID=UPI000882AFC8|nr:hypothetical protein [Pseudovibrio sp. Tun.PSC04-5.I4]SDQ81021.1 hypothetical protein SAMN04515695_1486 [Pseudovibrio sp. Tun.PSC04-5.I4]